jgi:hypothetical protein
MIGVDHSGRQNDRMAADARRTESNLVHPSATALIRNSTPSNMNAITAP